MKNFYCILLLFSSLLFSCVKDEEIEGDLIEDNVMEQDSLLGGWKLNTIQYQIYPETAVINAAMNGVQSNLERRMAKGSLYFTKDSVFYVETPDENVTYVKRKGIYVLTSNPATLFMSETKLICEAYAPYFYVKEAPDGQISLYLTKEGVMEMIREDGSIPESLIERIDEKVEDARFEFLMKRYYMPFFDLLGIPSSGI